MKYRTLLIGKVGESDLALRYSERESIADYNMSSLIVLDGKQLELDNLPLDLNRLIPYGYVYATIKEWLPFVSLAIAKGLL